MADKKKAGRRKGASGMEFGVLVGLVAVVAVAATATVGGKVREIFGGTANAVTLGMNGSLGAGSVLNLAGGVTAPTAPTINTSSLPGGTLGAAYSQSLSASGQNGDPVSWAVASGSLPAGISLNGVTGLLSGTPSAMGISSFSAQATDVVNGLSSSSALSISVSGTAPTITTLSLPSYAIGGAAYSQTLAATTNPSGDGKTWALSGGTLPSGITLAPTTGVLSGTTASTGTFPFNAVATDSVSGLSSSVALSLSVLGDPCPGYHVSGQNKCIFTYLGSNQSFVVPAGTASLSVKLWGAGGSGSAQANLGYADAGGGGGGYAFGTLAVSGGETITVVTGGGGGSIAFGRAFGGGGNITTGCCSNATYAVLGRGGGRSALKRGATELVTAGGGGGAYYGGGGTGGGGGGTNGGSGTLNGGTGTGAGGGTPSAGGAGAASGGYAQTGAAGQGGDGMGSGGGGGYWGGGGADGYGIVQSAGGGSGWIGGVTGGGLAAGGQGALPSGGTAGNSGDADRGGAGDGAAGGPSGAGAAGANGRVVVSW